MIRRSPYAEAIGIRADPALPRRLILTPGTATAGRPGFLHGGVITALLEAAAYAAIAEELGASTDLRAQVRPITLTVDFLRGGHAVETFAEAQVTRHGARIANLLAEAWQEDRDRPIAGARVTLRLRSS